MTSISLIVVAVVGYIGGRVSVREGRRATMQGIAKVSRPSVSKDIL